MRARSEWPATVCPVQGPMGVDLPVSVLEVRWALACVYASVSTCACMFAWTGAWWCTPLPCERPYSWLPPPHPHTLSQCTPPTCPYPYPLHIPTHPYPYPGHSPYTPPPYPHSYPLHTPLHPHSYLVHPHPIHTLTQGTPPPHLHPHPICTLTQCAHTHTIYTPTL